MRKKVIENLKKEIDKYDLSIFELYKDIWEPYGDVEEFCEEARNYYRSKNQYGEGKICIGGSRAVIFPELYPKYVLKFNIFLNNTDTLKEIKIYKKAKRNFLKKYFTKYYGQFQYKNKIFYVFERVTNSLITPKLKNFIVKNNIGDIINNKNYSYKKGHIIFLDYGGEGIN